MSKFYKFNSCSKLFLLTLFCICYSSFSYAQLTTSSGYSAQTLVQNYLAGKNITVSNITYTGAPNAIGLFNGTNSNIGLDSGIIITSGDVQVAAGANTSSNAGVDNSFPGDTFLTNLVSLQTFDASILAFDFTPVGSRVKFRYVFGSEEYNEFVCSGVNDVFGFFISGPGIVGKKNLAIVPNTNLPVSINTINNGTPAGNDPYCYLGNSNYFIDNTIFVNTTVQYDGFTVVLEAVANVIPCETYHLELAIADGGDGLLDSGVLLEAGSFSGNTFLDLDVINNPIDTTAIEGCTGQKFIFSITDTLPNDYVIHYSINGTAINGVDYTLIPDSIIIQAGQTSAILNITPIYDLIIENDETVVLTLILNNACVSDTISATVFIKDLIPINIILPTDTFTCEGNPITLFPLVNGGHGSYSYLWNNGTTQAAIVAPGIGVQTYVVTVKDGCQQTTNDTITVSLLQKSNFQIVTPPVSCNNLPVTISLLGTGSLNALYTWNFDGALVLSGNNNGPYQIQYPKGGTYNLLAIIIDGPCIIIDTATVEIDDCDVSAPNIITPNNDGRNDVLAFEGLEGFPGSRLNVWNRWGNEVYKSADYKNDWDGGNMPDGVYYYILNLAGAKPINSSLTIMRQAK